MLPKLIIKELICPVCKGELSLRSDNEKNNNLISGHFFCSNCYHFYRIDNQIPNFIPEYKNPYQNPIKENWDKMLGESVMFDLERNLEDERNIFTEHEKIHNLFKLDGKILDVGCSSGQLRRYLSPSSFYIGIEPDKDYYELRHRLAKLDSNLEAPFIFIQGIGEAVPFRSELFDSVIIRFTIEHLFDVHSFFSESFRVLNKGGKLYIGTGFAAESDMAKISQFVKMLRYYKKYGFKKTFKRIKTKLIRAIRSKILFVLDRDKKFVLFSEDQVENGHIYNDFSEGDIEKLGLMHGFVLDKLYKTNTADSKIYFFVFKK